MKYIEGDIDRNTDTYKDRHGQKKTYKEGDIGINKETHKDRQRHTETG